MQKVRSSPALAPGFLLELGYPVTPAQRELQRPQHWSMTAF